MLIDKRVAKKKSAIDRIAKKLLPQVRKADLAKLSGKKSANEEFESFLFNEEFAQLFEEPTTGQDPDIKDKKGTQPAVYYKGLAKSTKDKRDAHFKKHGKKDDDDNSAYKPAPGDADSETKTSKHTKRYHQMFNKEGQIKLDRRFRAFRSRKEEVELDEISINTDAEKRLKKQHKDERSNLSKEHEREMDGLLTRELRKKITQVNKEEFQSEKDLIAFIEETTNDVFDQVELDEAKGNEGLKKKAEKSGMPLGILRQVYNRGIAAWKTGHRPGTTPQQWGFARVNSFITKSSGTWGKADADLAAKVRKEETENVTEALKNPYKGKPERDLKRKLASFETQLADLIKKSRFRQRKDIEGEIRDMETKVQQVRSALKEDVNEAFEELFTEKRSTQDLIKSKLGSITNRKNYQQATKTLITLLDRKKKESKGKIRHGVGYYAAQIAKSYAGVDGRTLADMVPSDYVFEQGGAGDRGTEKVTKRYKKDTPGETVTESVDDLFEAHFEEEVTQKQLNDLERFADRLLDKFGIDVEFTRHFADRMNDERNKPAITIAELQRVFKKIAKNKAKNIRQNPDIEAVLKDIQADLNLPIVINYDSEKDEYEVVNKTIMRKKNFGTSSKVIKV